MATNQKHITVDRDWVDNNNKLKLIDDSYQGGSVYRAGKYLWQYFIEDDNNVYNNRLKRSYIYNLLKNIIGKYSDFLFEDDPSRQFPKNEEQWLDFLSNMTIDGKDSQAFYEEVYRNLLLDEKIFIFVDKRDNFIEMPYVQSIRRINVLKHKFDENNELEYITWYEQGELNDDPFEKNIEVYKFFTLTKEALYKFKTIACDKINKSNFAYNNYVQSFKLDEVDKIENDYGFVPVVYFERETISEEIADNQREIYNLLNLRQEVLFKLCFSPLVIQGAMSELKSIQYQSAIEIGEDVSIPPFRLEYNTATIDQYAKALQEIITETLRIAYPYDLKTDVAKTATEKQLDFNETDKKLKKHANDMEKIELKIYEMIDKIYETGFDSEGITVKYNKNFQLKSLENEIMLVDTMISSLQLPVEITNAQRKKVVEMIFANETDEKKSEYLKMLDDQLKKPERPEQVQIVNNNEFEEIGEEVEENSKK